jgi:nucleoside 2-deoxyribosyltransferase
MKVYIATTPKNKNYCTEIVDALIADGHEVRFPSSHIFENMKEMPRYKWMKKIFCEDRAAIDECDEVLALDYKQGYKFPHFYYRYRRR